MFEPQIRPPDSPEKKDFWGPKWPPIASLNLPPRNARIATCQRFERCLPFAFARAGAQRSSAARCTLVAPRSQRSRWTAGGGLPARAVDGRRICLVAACAGQRVNCNACGGHSTAALRDALGAAAEGLSGVHPARAGQYSMTAAWPSASGRQNNCHGWSLAPGRPTPDIANCSVL